MRLLLKRRYTPEGTLGRLYMGSRCLCLIREAPKSCFNPACHCLEEGGYELEPLYSEDRGWFVGLGERGRVVWKGAGEEPGMDELCPLSFLRVGGTPMFTKLAFLKLMDQLVVFWERGEILELQIVSAHIPYRRSACQTAPCS